MLVVHYRVPYLSLAVLGVLPETEAVRRRHALFRSADPPRFALLARAHQDAKQRTFDRIKSVLAVWEKPSQAIEKALADNAKLIADTGKFLAPDAAKLVYDLFLRLVPMHLAIAPPKGSGITTAIGKEYTTFCECDEGKPDDSCGPDVGEASVRQRLIGPQPYLVNPDDYFAIICCLVEQRYLPAKNALAGAKSAYQQVDAEITKYTAEIDERIKSLDKDAKAAIPSVIDCSKYEKDKYAEPRA